MYIALAIYIFFPFQKIKEPFLEAVKITLGDRYTDYMANVYTKTIDFILNALSNGYLDNNQCYELQSTKSPIKSETDQANGVPSDQIVPIIESDQTVPTIEITTQAE